MNSIVLTGRLTKDPELTFTPGNGTAVTKFTLAVNRPKFDKDKEQEADFVHCVCFGKRAEAIANYVQKGHQFGIRGRLEIKKYVDKDGNNRWSTTVIVEDFDFLQQKNAGVSEQPKQQPKKETNYKGYEEVTPIDDDGEIPF